MHASFTARGSSWRRYEAQIRIRTRAHARHGAPAAAGARSRDLGRAPAPAGHGSAVHGIIVVRLPGTVTGSVDPGPAQITCCLVACVAVPGSCTYVFRPAGRPVLHAEATTARHDRAADWQPQNGRSVVRASGPGRHCLLYVADAGTTS